MAIDGNSSTSDRATAGTVDTRARPRPSRRSRARSRARGIVAPTSGEVAVRAVEDPLRDQTGIEVRERPIERHAVAVDVRVRDHVHEIRSAWRLLTWRHRADLD